MNMLSSIYLKLSSLWLTLLLLFPGINCIGQVVDSTTQLQDNIILFTDLYYAYNFRNSDNKYMPYFLYSHNRNNEFNLNYGLLGYQLRGKNYSAALILQTGTFVIANYTNEPSVLKNIYQASAGFTIYKKLWMEAGIFPSHLGLETAISTNNYTVTRSIMAENSPYYETGVKLYLKDYNNLLVSLLILNGWQHIQDNNSDKAIGSQIQWKYNDKLTINSSSFFGNEQPDTAKSLFRFFHNFFIIYHISPKTSIACVFDTGCQQKHPGYGWNGWTTASLQAQLQPAKKLKLGLRAEYYSDPYNIILSTPDNENFLVYGGSANLDYVITDGFYFRNELRYLGSPKNLFNNGSGLSEYTLFITTSLAYKL